MSEPTSNALIDWSSFRPYLKLVAQNWWLFILLASTGYIIGHLITKRQLDIHNATSEILLESQETFNYQAQMLGSLGAKSLNSNVPNQQRILQSYDLIGRAVDAMNSPADYFFVGRLRTTQVPGFSQYALNVDPELCHPGMLGVPIDLTLLDAAQYQLEFTAPNGQVVTETHRFGERLDGPYLALTLELLEPLDRSYNEEELGDMRAQHLRIQIYNRNQRINQFRKSLSIRQVDRTSILQLEATSTLDTRPAAFLDTLSRIYIAYTQEARLEASNRTEDFINRQLEELTAIMDSLEQQVDAFKADKEILDLTREETQFFNTLIEMESQLRSLDLRLEGMGSLREYLASGTGDFGLPPTTYLFEEDPLLIEQVNQLFALRTERASALIDVTENSYQVRRLDSALRSTRTMIARYIQDTESALRAHYTDLQGQISSLEKQLQNLPATQRDILSMERKMQVNEGLYIFLLESKASTIISRAGIAPEATIIEAARYGRIIGPNKQRTILTAAGIGFLLALLIASIRMLFFERIQSVIELRESTRLPVIGGIPHYDRIEDEPIAILHDSRSPVTESFRSLRANLQYLLTRTDSKTLLISSLHPSEGKTFTSSNLASILAKAGKRVVLVDFDMHKPKVHKNMRLGNKQGLSTVLIGRAEINDVLQDGPIENLKVCTAGPIPPNASELVLGDNLADVFNALRSRFDYVLLDTPPILLISDALILMQHVDASFLVTNTERSSKRSIQHLESILHQNDLTASFILNNIRMNRWQRVYSKYAYKYGYGYGYGHGYGYGYGGAAYGDSEE